MKVVSKEVLYILVGSLKKEEHSTIYKWPDCIYPLSLEAYRLIFTKRETEAKKGKGASPETHSGDRAETRSPSLVCMWLTTHPCLPAQPRPKWTDLMPFNLSGDISEAGSHGIIYFKICTRRDTAQI